MNTEMQLQSIPLNDFVSALLFLKEPPMSYTQKQAKEHGLKEGNRVTVLTIERKDGTIHRSLYLYDTASYWARDGLDRDGIRYDVTNEPWNGVESCCFSNGD